MERNTMGSFIAALRKANGLTQKELAERLNVSDKAVSRWERDESCPDLMLVPLIAETFNVTADELLKGQKNQTENNVKPVNEMSPKSIEKLVQRQFSKFKNRSMISVGFLLLGFILLVISLSYLISENTINISLPLLIPIIICFITVFILQSVFHNSFISSINTDEIEDKYLYAYRWKAKDRTWLIISLVCLFSLLTVFILLESLMDINITPFAGFYYLIFGMILFAVLFFNKLFIIRNKKYRDETKDYENSKNTIKNAKTAIKMMVIFVVSVAVMFSALLTINHFSARLFTDGKAIENQQEFIDFMNTYNYEMVPDWLMETDSYWRHYERFHPSYNLGKDGLYYPNILDFHYGVLGKQSYTWEDASVYKNGKEMFKYRTNRCVIDVKFSHSDTRMPVTVYTVEDYIDSRENIDAAISIFKLFCIVDAIALVIVYRKKKEN